MRVPSVSPGGKSLIAYANRGNAYRVHLNSAGEFERCYVRSGHGWRRLWDGSGEMSTTVACALRSAQQELKRRAAHQGDAAVAVECPACGKVLRLQWQIDGFGQPMLDRPQRFGIHAGKQWGRQCKNSGELHLESPVNQSGKP